MAITFILLWLGAIGAWVGWSLGTRIFYRHWYGAFGQPYLEIGQLIPAIIFAFVGVVFGLAILASMGVWGN